MGVDVTEYILIHVSSNYCFSMAIGGISLSHIKDIKFLTH